MFRVSLKSTYVTDYFKEDKTVNKFTPEQEERLKNYTEKEKDLLNRKIDDSFKKIVVTKDIVIPHYDEYDILTVNIYDFLLDPHILEQ